MHSRLFGFLSGQSAGSRCRAHLKHRTTKPFCLQSAVSDCRLFLYPHDLQPLAPASVSATEVRLVQSVSGVLGVSEIATLPIQGATTVLVAVVQ